MVFPWSSWPLLPLEGKNVIGSTERPLTLDYVGPIYFVFLQFFSEDYLQVTWRHAWPNASEGGIYETLRKVFSGKLSGLCTLRFVLVLKRSCHEKNTRSQNVVQSYDDHRLHV